MLDRIYFRFAVASSSEGGVLQTEDLPELKN
jgi:hypothetical protein